MSRTTIGAAGLAAALIVALALPALAATSPHIVATPHSAMVNSTISLSGHGFPAHAKLTIAECSSTNWLVITQPCDTDNTIVVHTDRHGRFTSSFTVELCPRLNSGGHRTRQKCFIGNPQPQGVDTITLVGAARIIVTYP
jgi:hypothetical protein